jgi:hypothetical protein
MNARTLAGIALAFLAVFGLPEKITTPKHSPFAVVEPSQELKAKVAPVADALRNASPVDRALWAQVWSKAAVVVSGDAASTDVAFTDTRCLRQFTVLALDIAWRRIGGNKAGKYAGLREAVEAVLGETVGNEVTPVTPEMRRAYSEAAKAVAWAGMNRG